MIRRIIVAGGGTGGHLFPGMAVVEELRRRFRGIEVMWVGTERGIEARVLPPLGERLELLEVTPLKGRSPLELVQSVGRLPLAMGKAMNLVRGFAPDVVIGVGGYASGPVLAAASMLGIRTAILEQNAHVGLTNRLLARRVDRAYLSFAETAALFDPARARVVGNPVRRAFVKAAQRAESDPVGFEARSRTVLVLGGSQGARSLNQVVPDALARAGVIDRGFTIVHQTGKAMRDDVAATYRALGVDAEVVPFIDDVARAYANAALVIARAGATTLAELAAIGRPSILIPFPHAADDHQTKNAESLAGDGAAICVTEATLTPGGLADNVRALLDDDTARRRMAIAARRRGRPEAAATIVDDLSELLGARGSADPDEPSEEDAYAANSEGEEEPKSRPALRGSRPYVPRWQHGDTLRPLASRRPVMIDGVRWDS